MQVPQLKVFTKTNCALFVCWLLIRIKIARKMVHIWNQKLLSQQDNSRKEWAFKKAITIQTYCNYNPIPVPHNIISIVAMKIYECFRRKGEDKNYKKQNSEVSRHRTIAFFIPRSCTKKLDKALGNAISKVFHSRFPVLKQWNVRKLNSSRKHSNGYSHNW